MSFLPLCLRPFLVGLLLAAAAPAALAQAPTTPPRTQAGYYRLALGDFTVTALSDGSIGLPAAKLLLNTTPAQVHQRLAHDFLPDSVPVSINAYLIDTGTHRLLVDAGAGRLFGANGGHLLASLRAAGYEPAQIDAVLLTHIHADHSGGLVQGPGRQLAFPNAAVYVAQREVDFWLTPANRNLAPASHTHSFDEAEQTVRPVQAAGKLKPFSGDRELFPGVRAVASPGHGPGHTYYLIESQGQQLLLWGDAMHFAAVQFSDPGAAMTYDENPVEAVAQRRRLLAEASRQGYLIGGDHLSFPGLGHVRAEGQQYQWVPLNFTYRASR